MSKAYKSKLSQEVSQYADQLLSGYCICIDPSSGSQGSVPGYAIFRGGKLDDAGTIELPRGSRVLSNRLFLLQQALRTEFEQPDLLIVEGVPMVMGSTGGGNFHRGNGALIKAVGATIATWDCPILEPTPMAWHALLKGDQKASYVKTDANDAVMLGYCCLTHLARSRGEADYLLPDFLFKKEVSNA